MIPAIMPTYQRTDIAFERGEGAYLYTSDGRRYLDFAAGIAVVSVGHSHPHLVEALTEQAGKLWHCSNIFTIPGQQQLAERIAANTFADTMFFCNSGAEAVETGIKAIRRYHFADGNPQKNHIICMEGAFHGRTLATIYAGGQAKHTEGFGPDIEGFHHVPFGNMNALRDAITPEVGGILIEPIQGEGGYKPAPDGFLQDARAAADEFGLLLMFDEVQCGAGRTGKFFAHEWSGVKPDVVAIAKGMGGGFPVGACLATEEAAKGMVAGTHGSTYGGNPLAMAVASAVLDILWEPGFMDHVVKQGDALRKGLDGLVQSHPDIFVDTRGQGLMLGIKCIDSIASRDMVEHLRQHGLLTVAAGENVVRMAPPLIIDQSHIDESMELFEKAVEALRSEGNLGTAGNA